MSVFWWAKAVVASLVLGVAIASCSLFVITNQPRPPDPAVGLPVGATLVYSNLDGVPVRTFELAGCMFTESYEYPRWLLINRAFIGSDPAINCGTP